MTFEQFSAVVTPQRCMKATLIWGVYNLGMAVGNMVRWNPGQLGLNIASVGICIGSYYLFKEVLEMKKQTAEMEEIRIQAEAMVWDMEHGRSFSDQ